MRLVKLIKNIDSLCDIKLYNSKGDLLWEGGCYELQAAANLRNDRDAYIHDLLVEGDAEKLLNMNAAIPYLVWHLYNCQESEAVVFGVKYFNDKYMTVICNITITPNKKS